MTRVGPVVGSPMLMIRFGRRSSREMTVTASPRSRHQFATHSMIAASSPETLGMAINDRAIGSTVSRSIRSTIDGMDSPREGLEALEAVDVHHEDDRAADLDFDVFGEIEQARLERRGIGHGHLGPAPAGPFEDAHDRVDVLVLDADQQTGIAGAQE